jgi:hypothetical protein
MLMLSNSIKIALLSVIFLEIFFFFRLINIIKIIYKLNKKILKIFSIKKSDSFKQKLLFIYSKKIFFNSLKILCILFILFIVLLFIKEYDKLFYNFLISLKGFIIITIISNIYYLLRKNIIEKL